MRRLCLLTGLVLALAACGTASGRALSSGIAGRILAGPTCPVETVPPQPRCVPRPLAVTLRIRHAGGSAPPSTVHSSADGRFRARLAPGTYVVLAQAQSGSPLPRPPAALRVQVRAHHFTNINIFYDTGIR
ncbi:MAG: hypothetical protein M3065_15705 [Actinomycetota bacterium]|nr:hypothetical protein [Actinomycetota bacterium]